MWLQRSNENARGSPLTNERLVGAILTFTNPFTISYNWILGVFWVLSHRIDDSIQVTIILCCLGVAQRVAKRSITVRSKELNAPARAPRTERKTSSAELHGGGSICRNREEEDPSIETERVRIRLKKQRGIKDVKETERRQRTCAEGSRSTRLRVLTRSAAIPMCSAKLAGSEIALYVWFLHWYQVCEIVMLN